MVYANAGPPKSKSWAGAHSPSPQRIPNGPPTTSPAAHPSTPPEVFLPPQKSPRQTDHRHLQNLPTQRQGGRSISPRPHPPFLASPGPSSGLWLCPQVVLGQALTLPSKRHHHFRRAPNLRLSSPLPPPRPAVHRPRREPQATRGRRAEPSGDPHSSPRTCNQNLGPRHL